MGHGFCVRKQIRNGLNNSWPFWRMAKKNKVSKVKKKKRHDHMIRSYCCVCCRFSCVWLFMTLWTVAHQAPLSMGILQARVLEWVALLSSKGASGLEDWTYVSPLLHWQAGSSPLVAPWKPLTPAWSLFIYLFLIYLFFNAYFFIWL